MMDGMGGHHSAKSKEETWLTPPHILQALGPFDLDPCSPADRPWPTAAKHYTIFDNGLAQPWDGFVWCNPPYGSKMGQWLARCAAHSSNALALIFARTETEDFHEHVWAKADSLLFLRGRLHFHHINGQRAAANAGAPSVLVAYGKEAVLRRRRSGIEGAFVNLRESAP